MKELIERAKSGHRRDIARLISLAENDENAAREVTIALFKETGHAHVIGITGPPGSGKSTLVNELAKKFRHQGSSVGIVAVDPSSPFTGGALLGDRVRMRDLAGDDGIFIRSMASRGSLGGLSSTTGTIVRILDAAGFEAILVETVGAGQAEVDIASTAHTTLVVEAPGMGDEVQTIKAGILEVADILVVNKADRPGSNRTVAALKSMLQMGSGSVRVDHHGVEFRISRDREDEDIDSGNDWQVEVTETVATEGRGIGDLVHLIIAHREYLRVSGEWRNRERFRSRKEINRLLKAEFMKQLQNKVTIQERERMVDEVVSRKLDPYSAVDQLYARTRLPDH